MKSKPDPSIVEKPNKARIGDTLTTRRIKPKTVAMTEAEPFGNLESHRVRSIRLTRADRASLETMARRYRVKSLADFCNGIVMQLDREADPSTRVLFRMYED
jgi:hypothetical protein